jgi:hypothetical protein
MLFQINVLIVVVIIAMVLVYIMHSSIVSRNLNKTWPLYVSNCPDYWTDSNGVGEACISGPYNTTNKCRGTKNFKGTHCQKISKLDEYGCNDVLWDGVTYGSGNLFNKNKCPPPLTY